MSVIVAYKHDRVVYMGADTQTSRGDGKYFSLSEENFKIRKRENGLLMGVCGSVAVAQQLFVGNWFDFDSNVKLTKKYIVTKILPYLISALDENGMLEKKRRCPEMDASVLIAFKDKLFYISGTFRVLQITRYKCTGAGMYVALPAVAAIDPSGDINGQLVEALRISAYRTLSVGAPFVLIDTKNLEYRIVGE